jgi:translation elongation factor EF-1beta
MAVFRCNKCAHLTEVGADQVGIDLKCPACGQPGKAYDTTLYIRTLLDRYFALRSVMDRMQREADMAGTDEAESPAASETPRTNHLDGVNLFNTDLFSSEQQHGPLQDWFAARKIQIRPNHKAVDTTGFFDEVANEIGNNYELIKMVVEQIGFAQRKGYTSINLQLGKKSQKEAQAIAAFCRQLYEYSFASRYYYQKPEKVMKLYLQSSPQIQSFFSGEWLEWFVLLQGLKLGQERQISVSCARNLSIVFPNEDLHELDVFFILNGAIPVCIECKSGEFRESIEKHATLRKRLALNKEQYIVCVAGLPDDQAKGLSSMYGLSFVNEQGLSSHLASLS